MKLQITIDGKTYVVDVEVLEEDENFELATEAGYHTTPLAASDMHSPAYKSAWDAAGNVCRSPLMGLVMKVNVTPGQIVQSGEILIVLEAMKMETNVTAPRAGTLKTVHVAQGDSVKMNQILAELE